MKVKCRGFQGTLLKLEAIEVLSVYSEKECEVFMRNNIEIRTHRKIIVRLFNVKDSEIEVIHEN